MENRVLFLDFDGVLITWRSHFALTPKPEDNRFSDGWMIYHDPITAAFLCKLCTAYDLKIVISSTWRANPLKCFELLEKCNLKQFLHDHWYTPQNDKKRGYQIQEWLDKHPKTVDYRIIDDDDDMLLPQMDKFIHCCMWDGLSGKNMNLLIEWARKEKQIIV